jgi:UPF0271 protein
MTEAVRLALELGLNIGAHPSYPDRAGFGRKPMKIPTEILRRSLVQQIRDLSDVCQALGTHLTHVKPHGALYNLAAKDRKTAKTFLSAVDEAAPGTRVIGLASSPFIQLCADEMRPCWGEAFCDRRYQADGRLVPRTENRALITDPQEAAAQALQIAHDRMVTTIEGVSVPVDAQTLCIHGDTPFALEIAQAVNAAIK